MIPQRTNKTSAYAAFKHLLLSLELNKILFSIHLYLEMSVVVRIVCGCFTETLSLTPENTVNAELKNLF